MTWDIDGAKWGKPGMLDPPLGTSPTPNSPRPPLFKFTPPRDRRVQGDVPQRPWGQRGPGWQPPAAHTGLFAASEMRVAPGD